MPVFEAGGRHSLPVKVSIPDLDGTSRVCALNPGSTPEGNAYDNESSADVRSSERRLEARDNDYRYTYNHTAKYLDVGVRG